MITKEAAAKIGGKYGLVSAGIGVTAAFAITGILFGDLVWFAKVSYGLNILIGVIILFLSSYSMGRISGGAILIRQYPPMIVGPLAGMLALLITAFLSGWTGLFQEGLDNIGTNDDPFEDYIFKPMFWVSIFGIIPSLVVGGWFGHRVRKAGKVSDDLSE